MSNIYLSVIIPTYNAGTYIIELLNNLLLQIDDRTEIIVVDDGSTDNSYSKIKDIREQNIDKRVVLLTQENKGCSVARNYGLKEAKGDYVTFVDADDVLKSNFVFNFIKLVEDNPGMDIYITGVETYDETGRLYEIQSNGNKTIYGNENIIRAILHDEVKLFFPMWCKIIRRDFISDNMIAFYEDAKCMSDGSFYSQCYQYVEKLALSDYVGYEWRRRPGSISTNYYSNTSEVAARHRENCRAMFSKLQNGKEDKKALSWMRRMSKFCFEYPITHLQKSTLSRKDKERALKRIIDINLDDEVIDMYDGYKKICLKMAKATGKPIFLYVSNKIDVFFIFVKRVCNAIIRRLWRVK